MAKRRRRKSYFPQVGGYNAPPKPSFASYPASGGLDYYGAQQAAMPASGTPVAPRVPTVTPGGTNGALPYPGFVDSNRLSSLAQQEANAALAPQRASIQQQQAFEQARSEGEAKLIQGLYAQLAQIQSAVAPETQQIYSNAAHDQSAFAQGYSDALRGDLSKSADTVNSLLKTAGAPAGQMQQTGTGSPIDAAGNVLYGLGGQIPADLLTTSGAAFARADALLPGATFGRGIIEVRNVLSESASRQSQLSQQLDSIAAQYPSLYHNYLTEAQDQQFKLLQMYGTPEDRAAKARQENEARATSLFNAGLITQRQFAKLMGVSAWRQVPNVFKGTSAQKIDVALSKLVHQLVYSDGTAFLSNGKPVLLPSTDTAKPPKIIGSASSGYSIVYQDASGRWTTQEIRPPSATASKAPRPVVRYDKTTGVTTAVDPQTGKVLWKQTTGTPAAAATAKAPTAGQLKRAGIIAAQSFQGVPHTVQVPVLDSDGNPRTDPKSGKTITQPQAGRVHQTYQEAMRQMLAEGIPLAVAQRTLNRFWTKPGYDMDWKTGKWVKSATGRPLRPYQERHPKGDAASGGAASNASYTTPSGYDYPLGAKATVIGTPYQGTHTLYGNWESDNAVDLEVPPGTPVYATADGVIGPQIGAIGSNDPHMAGQRLHLLVAGNEFYYQHLRTISVHAGQHVRAGQLLGYTGALNHLHIASKTGNPLAFFGGTTV